MNRELKEASRQSLIYIDAPADERCNCLPLSSLHRAWEGGGRAREQLTPATADLNSHLRTTLTGFFPRSTPFSVLHLHISQLEPIHSVSPSAALYQRARYHAPDGFLEQVLVNARRAIRADDQILVHAGTGAVMIFPDVDQDGIQGIAERVYQSVSLLQAETVIPPLRRVTDILVGIGSFPKPDESLEQMLSHASLIERKLTLRPAISRRSRKAAYPLAQITLERQQLPTQGGPLESLGHISHISNIPFMKLPSHLPRHLKQLIPYQLACELRCAPVGRDHDHLTIAMADPTDVHALSQLEEVTGLSIFAVACEIEALDELLARKW